MPKVAKTTPEPDATGKDESELETLVLTAPLFRQRLRLVETCPEFRAGAGRLQIRQVVLA